MGFFRVVCGIWLIEMFELVFCNSFSLIVGWNGGGLGNGWGGFGMGIGMCFSKLFCSCLSKLELMWLIYYWIWFIL